MTQPPELAQRINAAMLTAAPPELLHSPVFKEYYRRLVDEIRAIVEAYPDEPEKIK
ncbi:hypothetical protein LQZ19_08460 [Treponema primitia]|uniref:hypothetical protein n=1 Tax=Treponema primitia TaxID=88058 RepID=UPI00397FD210